MGEQVTLRPSRARRPASIRRLARAALAAAGLAAASSPAVARAQARTFYLDRLFMAGAPDDSIAMWRPQMGDKTRFYGQLGLGFGLNPFRVENEIAVRTDTPEHENADLVKRGNVAAKNGTPVSAQLILYADIGVEIFDRFGFQVQFPAAVFQKGSTSNAAHLPDAPTVATAAPMDLRLDARAILFRTDSRSFKLGAEAGVWIPTGNQDSYGSDAGAAGHLGIAMEYDAKKVFFLLNTGFQFRPLSGINDFQVSHEWRYGFGAFVPIRDGSVRLGAQIFGSTGLTAGTTFSAANTPLEWMAEIRGNPDQKRRAWLSFGGGTRLTAGYAPDFRLVALAGYSFGVADTNPPAPGKKFRAERYAEHGADTDHDGIPDDIDLCPTEPEDHKPPNPDDGCPALPDRDGDGIPDVSDKCPDNPEDFDGIQDADGCPEDDADKDGIPDAQDACPKEPGEPSPEPAKNGCPQFIRRITGSSEIQILKQVQFATGKATILKNSFPILDEVVRLLKVNLEITHLDIEGHTDNKGSDDLNEKLSNDRANSVMKYLIEHGIDAGRLSAAGFGPRRPIADNNTADGRQKNRRVEFHIRNKVEGGGATPPPPDGAPQAPP